MRNIGDVLVCADAVEGWHLKCRQIVGAHFKTPPRVGKSHCRPLRFPPLKNRQVPRRPILDPFCSWEVLLSQSEKNQMASVAGGETRDFQVIVHETGRSRKLVVVTGEKLFLIVIIGAPR